MRIFALIFLTGAMVSLSSCTTDRDNNRDNTETVEVDFDKERNELRDELRELRNDIDRELEKVDNRLDRASKDKDLEDDRVKLEKSESRPYTGKVTRRQNA